MDFKVLVREHSDFLLSLFQLIVADEEQGAALKNAVVSPISVSVTLAMIAAGASGPTLDQLVSCLCLSSPASAHEFASQLRSVVLADASPKGGPLLSFVNGVWVERTLPLKPTFAETVHSKYAAVARPADFVNQAENSRVEINAWAKDETKGIIKEILPVGALESSSKLVLANALYFKGVWEKQFDASKTVDGNFYLLNGETVSVPMMTTDKKQEISAHDSCKILRLPYTKGQDGRSFSLYVILPEESAGLQDIEKIVSADFVEQKLVKGTEVTVGSFKLPRFKLSAGYEMPGVLAKLGLVLPFSNAADFSNMVDSPLGQSLSIDKIYHKAAIAVDEKGTEAAAATAAVVMLESMPFTQDFVADHPFLFVLKEDLTGIVVFIGHVMNPIAEGTS